MSKRAAKAATEAATGGRRCESCGRFLPTSSTEPLCASCVERGETAKPPAGTQVAAFPDPELDPQPAPTKPRRALPSVPPASSWPPRGPIATASPTTPRPAPSTLTERGIIIPRPSELHPPASQHTALATEGEAAEPPPASAPAAAVATAPPAVPAPAPSAAARAPAPAPAASPAPRSAARRHPMQATPVVTRPPIGGSLRHDVLRIAIQVLIALAIGIVVGVAIPFLLSR